MGKVWLAVVVVGFMGSARADSIIYSLTGVTIADGTVTGTITVDSATSDITAVNLTVNDTTDNYKFSGFDVSLNGIFSVAGGVGGLHAYDGGFGQNNDENGIYLHFSFPPGSAAPYAVDSGNVSINTSNFSIDRFDVVTGGAVVPAVAPEPSSLIFLASGVLGLMGALRRRDGRPQVAAAPWRARERWFVKLWRE